MRRLIVPIALVLALATGALLAETRMALAPIPIDGPRSDRVANVELVRAWYEGVNRVIATGEASALGQVLAPGFVNRTVSPGEAASAAALAGYLAGLRATHPNARVVPLDIAAEGDRVIVRVRVEGTDRGEFLGLPIAGVRVWGAVNVFRIASGHIVEHWGDGEPLSRFEPLLTIPLSRQVLGGKTVAFERRTYPPGHGEFLGIGRGFAVFLVETGELRFDLDGPTTGRAWRVLGLPTTAAASPDPVMSGTSVALEAGDAVQVQGDVVVEVRNEGGRTAVALVVTADAYVPSVFSKGFGSGSPGAVKAGARATAPSEPAAVEVDLLAGGQWVELPTEDAVLAIGRATLTNAGGTPRHAVTGVELLGVEAGSLIVSASDDAVWVGRGSETKSTTAETALLETGDGALIRRCAAARYLNAAGSPVELLLVTIVPTAGADATPPTR